MLASTHRAEVSCITRSCENDDTGWEHLIGDAGEGCNGSNQVAGAKQSTVKGMVGDMKHGCATEDGGESASVSGAGEHT